IFRGRCPNHRAAYGSAVPTKYFPWPLPITTVRRTAVPYLQNISRGRCPNHRAAHGNVTVVVAVNHRAAYGSAVPTKYFPWPLPLTTVRRVGMFPIAAQPKYKNAALV
ncbi:hypothetical protein, partial [Aliidiomarina quisquiliarum]|uniref:hypothetical protein n=1 Tax=Aliidiomarina quisquiliarum TaxID=2938947 RepID=UPI00208E238C